MQENSQIEELGMTDEELTKALEMLNKMTQMEEGKAMFKDVAIENDRSEYLDGFKNYLGSKSSDVPCKSVAITKGLGYDGKIHSVQIINPMKRVLKAERMRRKKERKSFKK